MMIQCCVCKRVRVENEWHQRLVISEPTSQTYCLRHAKKARRQILEEADDDPGDQCGMLN
jgi:hypothetical protein